jgi:alpha-tubulin suppressor-like RCC1 family protein
MIGLRALPAALLLALVATAPAAADTPAAVSAGSTHTCAQLAPRGTVMCWGDGGGGQLGDGTQAASATPVFVSEVAGASAIGAGTRWSCAIAGGAVTCWGNGQSFDAFDSTNAVPLAVRGVGGAIGLAVGGDSACAVLGSGGVSCWGLPSFQTGSRSVATPVPGISGARSVAAGSGFQCAALASSVSCWGAGDRGQLGNGGTSNSTAPVAVNGLGDAVAVSAGTAHACALRVTGEVACWGAGDRGQLGNGASADSAAPVAVTGISDAIAVSAGGVHTCAILRGGAVRCWGFGGDGQLGDGTRASAPTPIANPITDAQAISAGLSHTCALRAGGVVQCWGTGDHGELGDGGRTSRAAPVTVVGLNVEPPVLGQSTTLQSVSGTVRVRRPGAKGFVPLGAAGTLPLGTLVDTTRGKVRLTAAQDRAGRTQAGLFDGGQFRTSQTGAGLTVLTLSVALAPCRGASSAAGKKKSKRHVWGEAKGSFRTAGRYASATVQGTKWLTEDSCAGTLVRVVRGTVKVQDFVRHRTVRVGFNKRYLARPRRR